jgi:para-nitrobenzyl esterase
MMGAPLASGSPSFGKEAGMALATRFTVGFDGWRPSSALVRALVATAAMFLLSGVARTQVVEQPIPGDPVRIDTGLVSGKLLDSGVKAYLGLRFAQAPTGDLRWKAPQPLEPWAGVYHADRKMPECIQVLRPHNINHYFGEEATSEDCLFLNLWVPGSARAGDKLPVIVFIYGGAFTIGSSGMALYGGENVARSGAIFVNLNYRLGLLGFMAHPELTAESPVRSSGNYGILDQIAALHWIRRNIAAFGGDPDKVIISGQSAGARSVSLLQATPLAAGLFRGIVAMSGNSFTRGLGPIPPLADAERVGVQVADALKASGIPALRHVPADQILALQDDCQLGCRGTIRPGGPNADGYLLPAPQEELFEERRHSDVPVVVGFTRDEAATFVRNGLVGVQTKAQFDAEVGRLYGDKASEFHALYPASTDAQASLMAAAAVREMGWPAQGAWQWANTQARFGSAPVFVFQFSHVQPFNAAALPSDHPERIGAYHTSDVPYWFQTLDALNMFRPTRLWTDADRDLARTMTSMLISFAETGNPSTRAVKWPEWTPDEPRLLDIGDTIQVRPMNAARFAFQAANPPLAEPTSTGRRTPRD